MEEFFAAQAFCALIRNLQNEVFLSVKKQQETKLLLVSTQ